MSEHGVPGRAPWQKPNPANFTLNDLGFAWEFIRRNKRFCDVWEGLQPSVDERQSRGGMRVVELRDNPSALFPCLWSSPPEQGVNAADVAWHPLASPKILRAVALPPKLAYGAVIFDPSDYDLEKTLVVCPDGSQELVLRDGARTLQIHIIGGALKGGDALFVDTAGIEDSTAQLQALACFRELRNTGVLLNKYFPAHPHAVRLAHCLQALDGFLDGADHREIAVAMFGEAVVKRDWSDPRENLRDRVRRSIGRGRAMMERGFLGLLRG